MEKHVVVLAGGLSAEREVSLQSGANCARALVELGYRVTVLDPDTTLPFQLATLKPDVVFNALHGASGENGAIPGLLEVMNIPYTHSGILSSAFCMNKAMAKEVLGGLGIITPAWLKMPLNEIIESEGTAAFPMQMPYVIKAIDQGSTFGVYIVRDKSDLFKDQIVANPWVYGEYAIIEEYISGVEVSVAVLQGKALGVVELRPLSGFYDYEAKYTDGKTIHVYPAEIPVHICAAVLRNAEIAHDVAGCRTLSRSDFIYDTIRDKAFFLEINTHPGFTELSLVPEIAAHNGITFSQLVEILVADGLNSQHFDSYQKHHNNSNYCVV